MKIVFLDIDGVMNCPQSYEIAKRLKASGQWSGQSESCYFPSGSITALNCITEATGAKIVISSVWGTRAIPFLKQQGVTADILGMTPYISGLEGEFIERAKRGKEIAAWLQNWRRHRYAAQITHFVILDDDADMGLLLPWLVQTDGDRLGLTAKHATQAIQMLNE